MGDLSDEQNSLLRAEMRARIGRGRGYATAAELARALRRSHPSISDFLNGRGGVSHETAERFAALIGVDVRTLIGSRQRHVDAEDAPPAFLRVIAADRGKRWPPSAVAAATARIREQFASNGGEWTERDAALFLDLAARGLDFATEALRAIRGPIVSDEDESLGYRESTVREVGEPSRGVGETYRSQVLTRVESPGPRPALPTDPGPRGGNDGDRGAQDLPGPEGNKRLRRPKRR